MTLCAAVLAVLAGTACGRSRRPDPFGTVPASARQPERPGGTFRPPKDGRLSLPQLAIYEKVLVAALAQLRNSTGPRGGTPHSLGDTGAAPDLASATELGVDREEYLWIRERVLEAEAAAATARLDTDSIGVLERTLEDLKKRRSTATDDASRRLVDEQISVFGAEVGRLRKEASVPEPLAVRENVRILAPRRGTLEALETEFRALVSPPVVPPRTPASPRAGKPTIPSGL